jgi:predicted nucleic acid-binding protein
LKTKSSRSCAANSSLWKAKFAAEWIFFSRTQEESSAGTLSGICRDPKDDFILECAQTGNADLIVTGDKDLLSLERFGATEILTPRQYLDRAKG